MTSSAQSALVTTAAEIAAKVAGPASVSVDKEGRFPKEAIDALKQARLLSAFVPKDLGGAGCGMFELARMCEVLAQHCSSTAMIFAMHQIQVACLVRHAQGSAFFSDYLREICRGQNLIASVTSEVGIGGEMRTSKCALDVKGKRFELEKDASTISYGAHADDLLVTARRNADAPPNDQSLVLVKKGEFTLECRGSWDSLGMRGTCSPPFLMKSSGSADAIMATSFSDIASQTMVPFSHVLWANCWLGIAGAAVSKARAFVRQQARAKPGVTPPAALPLAGIASDLQSLRANVHDVANECHSLMTGPDAGIDVLSSISFALKMNSLKLSASEAVADLTQRCLLICGIMGYKNDTKYSVGQHLRDGLSAALMVSNDRIRATNGAMLLVLKDD